ncbi:uncharacterized protein [Apostichopus japonicus]|uniref:uncharacterized protein n=1 Tax=Stichopus japonicus TaxID=307972 RepID=UPI003AB56925
MEALTSELVERKVTPKRSINRKKRRKQRDPKRLSFKIKFDGTSDKPSAWSENTTSNPEDTSLTQPTTTTGESDVDSGIEGTLEKHVVDLAPRSPVTNGPSSFIQPNLSDDENQSDTALDLSRNGVRAKLTQSQVVSEDNEIDDNHTRGSGNGNLKTDSGMKRAATSKIAWQHKMFKVTDSLSYNRKRLRTERLQQTHLLHSSSSSGTLVPQIEPDRTSFEHSVTMATSGLHVRLGSQPIITRAIEKPCFDEEINNNAAVRRTSKNKPDTFQQLPNGHKGLNRSRRIVANARERNRVHTISAAFEGLRRAVPCYSHNQKLSKLAILRIACSYILALANLADLDYSPSQNKLSFSECVDLCTMTLQAEGRSKRKKSHD